MRHLPIVPLAFLAALPLAARGQAHVETARASGAVTSDEGTAVLLDRVWRKGDTVELPEGYLRIEEDPRPGEERGVGSFTVMAPAFDPYEEGTASGGDEELALAGDPDEALLIEDARAHALADAAEDLAPAPSPPAGVAAPAPDPAQLLAARCRDERSAYLAELWRSWGADVRDPAAFLDGLAAGDTRLVAYWLGLAMDPLRPLAWSSELRSRAEALAQCVRR